MLCIFPLHAKVFLFYHWCYTCLISWLDSDSEPYVFFLSSTGTIFLCFRCWKAVGEVAEDHMKPKRETRMQMVRGAVRRSFRSAICSEHNVFTHISVADPGYPREGGGRGTNLLFGIIFAENCMKMKKLNWEGSAHPLRPLDLPLHSVSQLIN